MKTTKAMKAMKSMKALKSMKAMKSMKAVKAVKAMRAMLSSDFSLVMVPDITLGELMEEMTRTPYPNARLRHRLMQDFRSTTLEQVLRERQRVPTH